ncbi:uroporphyrinogen III synthase [Duganella sp. Leaf126]|uniref:uroporphyrinogen-III synthase n=1 Tax=Duganella sp. Leaf126 TaxID=1736266 RepID=UPI0006FE01CD|nr:uroporphyrinogen-III synthase [Duganella sp. Leaf126]KQQ45763.1 uroporphyrinogen III synthase [Duganella sp. Leaf126]
MAGAVVITRPLAQARPLAARVAALGLAVEVLPLLDITPLPEPTDLLAAIARLTAPQPRSQSPSQPGSNPQAEPQAPVQSHPQPPPPPYYQLVAFVSPNAIDAAFLHLKTVPPGVTWAVVGEGSRLALAAHGVAAPGAHVVSPRDTARSDSEHLLLALDLAALAGKRALIIRGDGGRELLADGLRAAGVQVDVVCAYRRAPPVLTPALAATLRRLLGSDNHWIITSSEALRGLCALLAELDARAPADGRSWVVSMQQQHLIVPHARIAETAHNLGFCRTTLTGSGDERLLAALQSLL